MRTLACLLLFLTVACGAAPTPTPAAPLTFTGTGTTDSARFALPAGDYLLTWQTDAACYVTVTLGQSGIPPRDNGTGLAPTGQTRWNRIPAGEYYLLVGSPCAWHVTLSPAH
jgi:hypothetical protein